MRVIDISRTLDAHLAVWPGDTPFTLQAIAARRNGAPANLTTLTLSAHLGTHVDAPLHLADGTPAVAVLDLAVYWGSAQVVSVARVAGSLAVADFAHVDLTRAPRLLVKSAASSLPGNQFPPSFVYPSPELADHLRQAGIRLYGTDAPSVDRVDSDDLPGHRALLRNGIAILEGLDLSQAADGVYEFVALPLKIAGGDGSPVRAALRTIEPERSHR